MPNIILNKIKELFLRYKIFQNHFKQNFGIINFFEKVDFPLYTADEFLFKKNDEIKTFVETLKYTLERDHVQRCSNQNANLENDMEIRYDKNVIDYCYS